MSERESERESVRKRERDATEGEHRCVCPESELKASGGRGVDKLCLVKGRPGVGLP